MVEFETVEGEPLVPWANLECLRSVPEAGCRWRTIRALGYAPALSEDQAHLRDVGHNPSIVGIPCE